MRSAHDCSDGGLAVALAECTFDSGGFGASIDIPGESMRDDAVVFGESASRVLVSSSDENASSVLRLAAEYGVPARAVGRTGGTKITISVSGRQVIDTEVDIAQQTWATAFERYFTRTAA
jgi:phosphoribosylformylglycinamidine synthase